MSAKGSILTGAAGEDFVLYQLHLRGLLAAPAPRGAAIADLIVFDPAMSVGSMIQVKARTTGRDRGWHMREKHETLVHPRLFYALVDLEADQPVTYIVPSTVVAEVIKRSHETWFSSPGLGGRVRRQTDLRRLRPDYEFEVVGYPAGWLDVYRERWDLLTTDESIER